MIDLHSSQTMSAASWSFLSFAFITSNVIGCVLLQVGRNPPAPHTTPRRTRGAFAFTDLTLRMTLEALDIFRAAAGLPIIHVTEMLHQSTF
jgi:hypothetical protein